jgi:hypothetical protein
MPPAWGVEALANAGLATDSCCMKRSHFIRLMPVIGPASRAIGVLTRG